MFGSSKKKSGHSSLDIETVIGKNTLFKGTISGNGNIRIDGSVEGEILSESDIVIGEQGRVVAEIKAGNIFISGTVKGNVTATGKVSLTSSGRLTGDVHTSLLSIEEGASFRGNSMMESGTVFQKAEEIKNKTRENTKEEK